MYVLRLGLSRYDFLTMDWVEVGVFEFYMEPNPFNRLGSSVCVLMLKVQLQGIFQSKHVDHFQFQVMELQKQLTVADSVLMVWMEVQRTWADLESIFKGCDDICQQLPADAHRFQAIDVEFQVCTRYYVSHIVMTIPLLSSF